MKQYIFQTQKLFSNCENLISYDCSIEVKIMKGIKVVSKLQHHVLLETQEPMLKVTEDAVIIVKLSLNEIRDIWRHSQQFVIEYKQEKIVIDEFFQSSFKQDLILKDPMQGLFLAQIFEAENEKHSEIKFVKVDGYTSLLYASEIDPDGLASSSDSPQEMSKQTVLNMSKTLGVVGDESNRTDIKSFTFGSDDLYSVLDVLNLVAEIADKDLTQQGVNLTTSLQIDELIGDNPDLFNVENQNWQLSAEQQQNIQMFAMQGDMIDLTYPYVVFI